ncbi:hypothetical protein [Mesorhizobium sp. M7A.F.Ca.ET.027.03.2.1]|uniref:hypothetical protein n=1 Tax=Mesorhizobium sp. M7A.F.Ca.ET.027.03.2.1 TaxID=2496656 RepID=UPI001AED0FE9|nr:hypothetical protein [Mesorhizobium sp. M7A.F.Ca.ET.027.03.2.1]
MADMSSIGAATSLPALIGFASRFGGWRILYLHHARACSFGKRALRSAYATLGGLLWIGDPS